MENIEKIIKTLNLNHDGIIIEIKHENNELNLKIEIGYLANMINKDYAVMNYRLLGFSKLEFIEYEENDKKYANIDDIEKMELTVLEAKKEKNEILIYVQTLDYKFGQVYLCADDIIIYDQNNIEIEYNELLELCKKYWDSFSKKKEV